MYISFLIRALRTFVVILAVAAAACAHANELRCAQLDPLGRSDRIILELDRAVDRLIRIMPDQRVEILLEDTRLSPIFDVPDVPDNLTLISAMTAYAQGDSQVVILLQLRRDAEPSEQVLSERPCRIAVDLAPKATTRDAREPEWIPGDRPIPTKYAEIHPEGSDPNDVRLSKTTLSSVLVIAFLMGAAAMAFLVSLLDRIGDAGQRARADTNPQLNLSLGLPEELSHDLDRLSRIADREQVQNQGAPSPASEERVRLVLKLIREGREISAIAKVLELTPDQVKEILNRHS